MDERELKNEPKATSDLREREAGDLSPMKSHELYRKACRYMPGGVNSPVRSFRVVDGSPVPIHGGRGSRLVGEDGKEYVDMVMGWGSLIMGHARPEVEGALKKILSRGWNFGALTPEEVELAEILCESVPSLEMIRLVNTGTEATMSALRLARAYTGKSKVIKFEPCYHGHSDGMLTTGGLEGFASQPASLGIPWSYVSETLTLPFNEPESLRSAFELHGGDIAAVITEPIPGNAGVILPKENFFDRVRELCDKWGSLLILDEVIAGFRFNFGDCGSVLGVEADIVCLGKIIGGGLPMGAYGGRREIMEMVSPLGGMYQAGTFSGNLASVTAGLKTLELLREETPYPRLEKLGLILEEGLREKAAETGVEAQVNRFGSMLSLSFLGEKTRGDGAGASVKKYGIFFRMMLEKGFYLPPSPLESWFLSAAHTEEDVTRLVEASTDAFQEVLLRHGE